MGSRGIFGNIFGVFVRNYVLILILTPVFIFPITARAGVFSFIANLFSSEAKAEEVSQNVQNMPLLVALANPDYDATTTPSEVFIVEGTSLSKDSVSSGVGKSTEEDLISIYVVHKGDNLPAIARMFGVSVNTIKWANDLNSDTIQIGQTLIILPISGIKHVVKSGDTIQSIAKQHKGDVEEIMQYNNLTSSSKLVVGDIVIVPDGEASTVYSSSGSASVVKPSSSYPTYDGYYMRPIVGGVKTQGIHGHNGVDLASNYGANIYAAADGVVLISRNYGWNGGYGQYIVIKHPNGTQTLYAHLSGTYVSAGDSVKQGQVIGAMGHSGQVNGPTGTHLHFEIRGARNPF